MMFGLFRSQSVLLLVQKMFKTKGKGNKSIINFQIYEGNLKGQEGKNLEESNEIKNDVKQNKTKLSFKK